MGTKREQASNSATALSAGVDYDVTYGDALLDSGASHVILPMNELTPEGKKLAKPRSLYSMSRGFMPIGQGDHS
eukprot:6096391-Amphidinium_carterae.1